MLVPEHGQQPRFAEVLKSGWNLLAFTNEILNLVQHEAGKIEVSMAPVSLLEVLHECRSLIEPLAQSRGISMKFPQCDLSDYSVLADQARVKQVLIILLFNAIKHNTPGGSVAVECALSPTNKARVSVRDTGQGLDLDKFEQLCQPSNLLITESAPVQSASSNLVVTKRLIELMGGAIGVEKTADVGHYFWFELSLMPVEDKPPT